MDWASSDEPASGSEARREILEIAKNRPGTHVAKCIQAYDEQSDLAALILLLEELSKNTDYSTDLRISLGYYIDELLRHCLKNRNVSRRSAIVAAGSALQYCGKIYGDRVECMYQVVEHQIEALLSSEAQKEPSESKGPENNETKPEEPRKRRAKKLTKKEVDPYLLTVEPKKFRVMQDEKRFSATGFVKCSRNRTIEYLYQDHTPPNLWRHAPIVDPHNPYELDEKKQYKMFTYHVEHRYNTLLPDIPFERLNLIKEYVHTNNVNTAEILNEHKTTKDYLNEYIALENQMLASRYGATVRTRRRMDKSAVEAEKRSRRETTDPESPKKLRLDDSVADGTERDEGETLNQTDLIDQSLATGELLQNQISVDSGLGDSLNSSQEDSAINSTQDESQVESSTLCESQVENPALSSTLAINESSILDSTRIDLPPAKEGSFEDLIQIDSGIDMDEVNCDTHLPTAGQCFDDEGVVLSDFEDLRLLSPKVVLRDIMRDVPNKENISVVVGEEVTEVSSIKGQAEDVDVIAVNAEEAVNVPREVCYPIERNILGIPQKHLRKRILFKLPQGYELFKQARLPSKREAAPKPPTAPRVLNLRIEQEENTSEAYEEIPGSPLSLEFDYDMNFLGFRRHTLDSGFDIDTIRAWSATVSTIGEAPIDVESAPEAQEAVPLIPDAADQAIDAAAEPSGMENENNTSVAAENSMEDSKLESTAMEATSVGMDSGLGVSLNSDLSARMEDSAADLNQTSSSLNDSQRDQIAAETTTLLDESTIIDEAPATKSGADKPVDDQDLVDCDASLRSNSPTESEDSQIDVPVVGSSIRDWHQRLAPALEAAHERQNFNIKDLGTEILEVCQKGGGTATLKDVMKDKDPSIMCRYMLASLVLTNHGNVALSFGGSKRKSEPLEISQFCMELKSTKRMEIHPEDDVGNIKPVQLKPTKPVKELQSTKPVKAKRKSTEMDGPQVFSKTVRLIQPIPKVYQSPSETDSGISSMSSLVASSSRYT
ncbi:uncharacterized protein Dana_GF17549, isoform D [Drosophila ananassae]|uniref:Uncharacterized protein, isoform B n=1 Tax=Drosophila ananassae TaxID=7217 RepID=A0A0P9ANE5_DROAN|nr:uncharacterized protein LOC6500333 isoform X1 [Drosophila ananassae]XP_014766507.1 uncharacterized protein LOC6500333 isoform X1 [Drosophila ananassae]KPU79252.1 uncharacterized protein Dana_GF17549, isoform B [Drosophila ananassae]KPU79253.1 uncharacterized protein Dana_GF17549, isoform D [Drosophila ananassae]